MTERALIGQQAREFCDGLWQRGDFWDFESSQYERARCARLLTVLAGRRYARALEIGCGAGRAAGPQALGTSFEGGHDR